MNMQNAISTISNNVNFHENYSGLINFISIAKTNCHSEGYTRNSGSGGVRTPGLWIKSPSLYLAKLQTQLALNLNIGLKIVIVESLYERNF